MFHHQRAVAFVPPHYDGCTIMDMADCKTMRYERARQYVAWTLRGIILRVLEEARMRRLERQLADRFDGVTVISEAERDALLALDPRYRDKIVIFRNYIRPLCPIGRSANTAAKSCSSAT